MSRYGLTADDLKTEAPGCPMQKFREEGKPLAFMRPWAATGRNVMSVPRGQRPKGWQMHDVTSTQSNPDDIALFPAGVVDWRPVEEAPEIDHDLNTPPSVLVYGPDLGWAKGSAYRLPNGALVTAANGFLGDWGITHFAVVHGPAAKAGGA